MEAPGKPSSIAETATSHHHKNIASPQKIVFSFLIASKLKLTQIKYSSNLLPFPHCP
jgi:hypothetical protein